MAMEVEDFPESVQREFYKQTGFSLWSVLDGTTHVSKLVDAQLPRVSQPAPGGLPELVVPPRGEPENDVDEAAILLGARVEVSVAPKEEARSGIPASSRGSCKPPAVVKPRAGCEISGDRLQPSIAWTNLDDDISSIESGNHPHQHYTGLECDKSVRIEDHRRASALLKASKLTTKPVVRKRYEEAALALLTPPQPFLHETDSEDSDFDDHFVARVQPCALEKETRPYKDWLARAMETRFLAVDATPEQLMKMNFYSSFSSIFPWPSVDQLVEQTWEAPMCVVPQVLVRVPVNPEALRNSHAFVVQGIGNKRRPDFEVKAERDLRDAKRRALELGLYCESKGRYDPFGPTALGGMKAPEPPPSFEFADMLKRTRPAVADVRTFASIGPASGMHLFVYDELVPPLRAVRGMLTTTSLFHTQKAKISRYKNFPFTNRLKFAGPHDRGPLFAPIEKTPQATMDNDHMRAYIAPVHTEETTDFVVRMKNGKIVEIVPVHSRVAVGQVFPKHRKKKIKKELEDIFYNRALTKLFPAAQGGMGRPANVDRLLQLRPKLMERTAALSHLKKFTAVSGPKLVSYDYSLGIPSLRPECTYTLALETALLRYEKVKKNAEVTSRAINPKWTVGKLEGYLAGKGLLLCGGKGAPDPGAVNLSGVQTLKSGATQAKEDLEIFPEIVGGMYPLPREKDAKTGKPKKMREGSSSDTRTMTRAQYAQKLASLRAELKRDDSADSEFLDAKLKLIRTNKDTTSDRWEILRFLNARDKSDPTLRMSQNTLRRFSMTEVCKESCRQSVHALYRLVCAGRATLDGLPPAPKFDRELRTREILDPPYLERFTIYVMYRGGRERIFSEGGNSREAWALKTFYTARKISYYFNLEREFSPKLFHSTSKNTDLQKEIVEIQELRRLLEEELLAGLPVTDAYAKQLLNRAKTGTL